MQFGSARTTINDKHSIQQGLREGMGAVADWVEAQPDAAFEQGPEGRWSTGQHLEHLVRSVQPIIMGMAMPRILLRMVFGTVSRSGMDYTTVMEAYEAVLDKGGKAGGRYIPPAIPAARKPQVLARHRRACEDLVARIDHWSDADLDRHGAKHPLMGQLSLREVLFFTIHHHDHHLETLRRDYGD